MIIELTKGKLIATLHEVVVKSDGNQSITMQAEIDAIELIGRGANVVSANLGGCKWSIKLDDESQLVALSEHIGIAIR